VVRLLFVRETSLGSGMLFRGIMCSLIFLAIVAGGSEDEDIQVGIDERMQWYAEAICDRCEGKGLDCGCDLGLASPLVSALRRHVLRHEYGGQAADVMRERKWVLVRASGGAGNQLLQLVYGLELALMLDRSLAVSIDSKFAYPFDGVLRFPTADDLLGWGLGQWFDGLDIPLSMCGDLGEALEGYPVVVSRGFTVAMPILNPHSGAGLGELLRWRPFFFLSHLFWTGRSARRQPVHAVSLPEPLPWDGNQTLGSLILRIRASRPRLVVGLHARTNHHRTPYVYHDTSHHLPDVEGFCGGRDASALLSMSQCLRTIIARQPPPALSPDDVLVIWATDNDDMAVGLLEDVLRVARVVAVQHTVGSDRHDEHCWEESCEAAGLVDMELLGEADEKDCLYRFHLLILGARAWAHTPPPRLVVHGPIRSVPTHPLRPHVALATSSSSGPSLEQHGGAALPLHSVPRP